MVTMEVATPSATTGEVPVIEEFAATGARAVKVTVTSAFTTGEAMDKVFTSAVVELKVQVATPKALVALQDP